MRYHLLIDADDTPWENNIYFEQAIDAFITLLNHSQLTPKEVRAVLDEVERLMGYGSVNFTRSLVFSERTRGVRMTDLPVHPTLPELQRYMDEICKE